MPTFDIEDNLSRLHGKEYVLLAGNATAGIYLTLKVLGLRDKKIAIPNNVCINVPIAVKLSGNTPKYLDISRDTMGLSVESLQEKLNEIDAVIAVHSYGSPCAIEEIKKICKNIKVPLIEDFAVAQGAKVRNLPVGSFGDVSITSFGAGKIIDSGHGGAILTNNRELFFEIVNATNKLDIYNNNYDKIDQLNVFYKQLYNNHYGKDINKYIVDFQRKVEDTQKAFLFNFDDNFREIINSKLIKLKDNIRIRSENASNFHAAFSSRNLKEITVFNPPQGGVYWRFNVFIDKHRNELLKYLLSKKYKVSSWYPSVNIFFESRTNSNTITPFSDWAADSILNLWVNQEIDDSYVNEITDEIVSYLKGTRDG
jgi:dTDP-4-amino-4,6-dideoxygalactose transaminase